MTILPDGVLLESKSAREHQLKNISHDQANQILNQIKALYFALWKEKTFVTTLAVAQFYQVKEENLRQLLKTYRDELEADGLIILRGKALKDARDLLSLPSRAY